MASSGQYIVSARKYRPATFQTVVGQRALTATLKNAITGGKLAQAYLFCGPRGVGKTSCARIFAKTINCTNPTTDGEACGQCESCKAIERGSSFNLVELDAASNNSVDNIRAITEQVNIPPQESRYRVFIIDEVHMLSNAAFNAFLKTLEEPPKNVIFILATTERHKVIPTIMSRCQVYDFRRITVNDIIDHLSDVARKEGVNAEREALGVIALNADGAMRDALSIFDQVVASTQGNLTYEATLSALNVLDQEYFFRIIDIFRIGDVAEALLVLKDVTDKGFDPQIFINGLASHIRNLMVSADPRTVKLLETSQELSEKYMRQAPTMPVEWYYTAIKILNDTDYNYKMASNKRLLVELALIRLSRLLGQLSSPTSGPGSGNIPPQVASPTDSNSRSGQPSPQTTPAQPSAASGSYPTGGIQTRQNPGEQPVKNDQPPFATPDGSEPPSAPAPVKEATRMNRGSAGRPKSFRLSDKGDSGAIRHEHEKRDNPFTSAQFQEAWNEYASTHPDQRILVAAMRSASPEALTPTAYRVKVDHPAQKQAFESSISALLEFLKARLVNDDITLAVEVNEKPEDTNKMSSKEFLKVTVESNPELAKFLKMIDAELE